MLSFRFDVSVVSFFVFANGALSIIFLTPCLTACPPPFILVNPYHYDSTLLEAGCSSDYDITCGAVLVTGGSNPLDTATAATVLQCAALCDGTPGCLAWTYDLVTCSDNCELYDGGIACANPSIIQLVGIQTASPNGYCVESVFSSPLGCSITDVCLNGRLDSF
jgi:hypothetical protein